MSALIEIKLSKVLGTASLMGRSGKDSLEEVVIWAETWIPRRSQQVKVWGRMSRQKEEQLWRPWGGSGLERNSVAGAYGVIDMGQGDIWGRQAGNALESLEDHYREFIVDSPCYGHPLGVLGKEVQFDQIH